MSDSNDWQRQRVLEAESNERAEKCKLESKRLDYSVWHIFGRVTGNSLLIHITWAIVTVKVFHIVFVMCEGWK
jgi:hypothetical protein